MCRVKRLKQTEKQFFDVKTQINLFFVKNNFYIRKRQQKKLNKTIYIEENGLLLIQLVNLTYRTSLLSN